MMRIQTYFIPLAAILIGCGRSNYFLRLDTPPGVEGFLGFRWTSPSDLIERRFLEYSSGSVPIPELSTSFVHSYTNVSFLSKRADTCQLICDQMGYYRTRLVFKTTDVSAVDDLRYFRDRLSNIYGVSSPKPDLVDAYPQQMILSVSQWFNCRLELALRSDSTIEIDAYYHHSCFPGRTRSSP